MKTYAAYYDSPKNAFKGIAHIESKDHKEAMSKFFAWIATQPVWEHLWHIDVHLVEVEKID